MILRRRIHVVLYYRVMNPLNNFQKQMKEEIFDLEHWAFLSEIKLEDPILALPSCVKNIKNKMEVADKVIICFDFLLRLTCTIMYLFIMSSFM